MRERRIAAIGYIIFWIAVACAYFFRLGGARFQVVISDVAPIIAASAAFVALCYLLRILKLQDSTAKKWVFLTAGVFLFLLGEVSWLVCEVVLGVDPFPSIADIFWLAGYIPFLIGLIIAIRETRVSLLSARTLFLFMVIGCVIAVSLVFLIQPIFKSTEISLVEKLLDLAYPLLDLILIILTLVLLILYEKGSLGKPWLIILASFMLFTTADLLFSYFTWMDVYERFPYCLIDLFWIAAYLAISLGAMYKKSILDVANLKAEVEIPQSAVKVKRRIKSRI